LAPASWAPRRRAPARSAPEKSAPVRVGVVEVGAGQVAAGQMCAGEIGAGQVGKVEIGAAEIRPAQVGAGQLRRAQIGAAPRLPGEVRGGEVLLAAGRRAILPERAPDQAVEEDRCQDCQRHNDGQEQVETFAAGAVAGAPALMHGASGEVAAPACRKARFRAYCTRYFLHPFHNQNSGE
jgi:hypothetical protein